MRTERGLVAVMKRTMVEYNTPGFTSEVRFDVHNGNEMLLPLSHEPRSDGGVPADPLSAGGTATCQGCGDPIQDRFYLCALDRRWHNQCLRCCDCQRELEAERSCYVKDGFIYCKDDYFRRFGLQKCSKCRCVIYSGDMVMRARNRLYHVNCFRCAVCDRRLVTGDHFGMSCSLGAGGSRYEDEEGFVYCRIHYEQCELAAVNDEEFEFELLERPVAHTGGGDGPEPRLAPSGLSPLVKAHHRKRKSHGGGGLILQEPWTEMGMSMIDTDSGYGAQTPSMKQKRMRTSFKHYQLRTMKQYFALNHNPDAKDLKQLAQKTGLSKRVLQVWFQNARAKYRRSLGKGGGGSSDCSGELTGLNDENSRDGEETAMLPDSDGATDISHSPLSSRAGDSSPSLLETDGLHCDNFSATGLVVQ